MTKYTDEQVKKALELCSSENFDVETSCASCPLYTPDRVGFEDDMCLHRDKLALDLINRLQAQNERDVKAKVEALYKVNDLKLEIERLKQDLKITTKNYVEGGKIIKSEAIKEFWNQRPPMLNPNFKGKEQYNKGWNDCISFFAEEYKILLCIEKRNEKDCPDTAEEMVGEGE